MQAKPRSECFVGIDVGKDRLDVHVRPAAERFVHANQEGDLASLVQRLTRLAPTLIVLEASGGYETVPAALATAGLPVAIVNPRQVCQFAGATGRLAKTDEIDAAIIAHFAEAIRPEPRPLTDDLTLRPRELLARRRQRSADAALNSIYAEFDYRLRQIDNSW